MKHPIIISFSGGLTSAYMAHLILNNLKYLDYEKILVYANTGKENEQTLQFIKQCSDNWKVPINWVEAVVSPVSGEGIRFKMVDFETASRQGEPFNAIIEKYGLPNKEAPHCSKYLKERPIKRFIKSLGIDTYKMAIGLRIDERRRLNRKREDEGYFWPLIDDFPTTKKMVDEFWNRQPFTLDLKPYEGNCDFCWKKSLAKRIRIIQEKPQTADWWEYQEKKDGEYIFDRDGHSIPDIRRMAAEKNKQIELDFGLDCHCFI